MKRTYLLPLMLLLLTAFVSNVSAQDAPSKERAEMRQKLQEKILARKHEKIKKILSLDEEQAKKFFAVYEPAEKEMAAIVKERTEEGIKLLKLTRGDYTDADVDPTITRLQSLNTQIQNRYDQLNTELKPVLNPRQRARLLVFEQEFNRRIRETIRERRQDQRKGRGGLDRRPPERPDPRRGLGRAR